MANQQPSARSPDASSRQEQALSKMRFHTSKFPEVDVISAAEVRELQCPYVLVDVRLPEERAVSIIKGAITREEFERKFPTPGSVEEDMVIIPYCTIGYRSGEFGRKLLKEGYPKVRNSEGIVLWTYEASPAQELVTMNGSPMKRVHTYGPPWDLANPEYKSVQFGVCSWLSSQWRALRRCCGRW
jgi:rhodanese-related sulfurtransferase